MDEAPATAPTEGDEDRQTDGEVVTRLRVEADAREYRSRLRSGGLRRSTSSTSGDVGENESDDEEGPEEDDIAQLIAGNETLQQTDPTQVASHRSGSAILTVASRQPIVVPDWGDELVARYIQEQRNVLSQRGAVDGLRTVVLTSEPPTGPEGYIMIPATMSQFLAIHDAMKLSQQQSHRATYPEPAFNMDIQQFMLTCACPWVDRNLHLLSQRLGLKRNVQHPVTLGHHFLVAIMRPDMKTRWRQRRPQVAESEEDAVSDTSENWVTLDHDVPARQTTRTNENDGSQDPPQSDADRVLACDVSTDVDSIIVLCDQLPLCSTLQIPSTPSRQDTMRYSNKLCLPAGPGKVRTLLSRIPNFNLGRSGRLTVNMFFPDAYDPSFQGMGSSQIDESVTNLLWDLVIQPAIVEVYPKNAYNSLPQSGQYEADRQAEIGGRARRPGRSTDITSDKLAAFVSKIRHFLLLAVTAEPSLASFGNFKFLLSLQGFKLQSFASYDDLTQAEYQWFERLGLDTTQLRPLMLFKGYLKGIRKVTADVFAPNWLDFNGMLQQGIARVRRLVAWENATNEQRRDMAAQPIDGDALDRLSLPTRRRDGPSLQLAPDMSQLCNGGDCDTCGVWVDVAAEIGCAGKVTVWNHEHCFDVVNSLIGRRDFSKASEWRSGVRMDEVATMPGLGGVGFTDKRAPTHGFNSPTPYIQLYCQEKVPTHAPFGSKARGAQDRDAIPARKLPMKHLLNCAPEDDSPLEGWIAAEDRILSDAASNPDRSFPARTEVRTSLSNLLEVTCNVIVAIGRAAKSAAFRHYDKDDWFRWKGLRIEHLARLPSSIFGRRAAAPSDWTIVHALLASQTFVHSHHARISDITIEQQTVNMHCLYLRVEASGNGVTYQHPLSTLTLDERAKSNLYRPFFPAGVRTLHGYFDPTTGLDFSQFERRMQGMSSEEEKWDLKVRRAIGCARTSGITRLKTLIKYPSIRRDVRPAALANASRLNANQPAVFINQDAAYTRLEGVINEQITAIHEDRLVLRNREARELEDYLEQHEILDVPDIILRYGRSLGLLEHLPEASRLERLREQQQDENRQLAIDGAGRVHVQMEIQRDGVPEREVSAQPLAHRLNAGGLDIYNFQQDIPACIPKTTQAVRALEIQWDVECSEHGLEIPQLAIPPLLRHTAMPAPRTQDDHEDDKLYREWLRRAEDPSRPFSLTLETSPSVADMVVFIFSLFEQQLLRHIPKTIRANSHFPSQVGQPYIKALTEDALSVSQHLMRDSYAGLPARLTRFVLTQYTAPKWKGFTAMFFPTTLEDCEIHPGWLETKITYLDLWRGLMERVDRLPDSRIVIAALGGVSRLFIESFKVLPDLTGKVYKPLRDKLAGAPVSIWDDSAFQKAITTSIDNFVPRWMTINPGDRVSNRVRLAYTFTAPDQKAYLGSWQDNVEIKESRHNYAVLHPSPAPFEYPWLKENYHTIISERGYMVWKEGVSASRFSPEGKERGIGHDWWDGANHSTVSCSVCRVWTMLNPPSLTSELESVLDCNRYNLGGRSWGYFACSSGDIPRIRSTKRMRQDDGSGREQVRGGAAPVNRSRVMSRGAGASRWLD